MNGEEEVVVDEGRDEERGTGNTKEDRIGRRGRKGQRNRYKEAIVLGACSGGETATGSVRCDPAEAVLRGSLAVQVRRMVERP